MIRDPDPPPSSERARLLAELRRSLRARGLGPEAQDSYIRARFPHLEPHPTLPGYVRLTPDERKWRAHRSWWRRLARWLSSKQPKGKP